MVLFYVNSARCVTVEAHGATLLIDVVGSQVVSWITQDHGEQMYISQLCGSPPESSIRAGNPICYPQFATVGPLTKHGFIRMMEWTNDSNVNGKCVMKLHVKDHECNGIQFTFTATFIAEIVGPNSVELTLTIHNEAEEPITRTAAFHPYFAVGDVTKCTLLGVKGAIGFDKTGVKTGKFVEDSDAITIEGGLPIDTMYFHDENKAPIHETTLLREPNSALGNLTAQFVHGFKDAVFWNIGEKDVADLADMPNDDWKRYVCMEQALLEPSQLAPNASETFAVRYVVSENN